MPLICTLRVELVSDELDPLGLEPTSGKVAPALWLQPESRTSGETSQKTVWVIKYLPLGCLSLACCLLTTSVEMISNNNMHIKIKQN